MLNFTEDYWKDEERDGYRVTRVMKKAWAVQMTVLDMVLEIADKHGIRIFMDYGSLLGTIRHGGYIPWDDDLDLCVLREDYMKLLRILKDELPDYCAVYSFYTAENYAEPKGFIANRKIIDLGIDEKEAEITKRYYGCPYVTGLDLYPLDYVPADGNVWENVKNLYTAAYDLAFNYDAYVAAGLLEEYLPELEKVAGTKVKRDEHLRTNIWKLADQIAMMTKRRDARYLCWYPDCVSSTHDARRKLNCYQTTVMKPFEMMQVPVPEGYEEILKVRYGENYMTPVQGGAAHEYPFFAPQERKILKYHLESKLVDII